jgi:hypothetical protein
LERRERHKELLLFAGFARLELVSDTGFRALAAAR